MSGFIRRLALYGFGFGLCSSVTTSASADETKRNVRELCRLDVASQLLQLHNDLLILRDQIALSERRNRDLLQHRELVQRELKTLTASPESSLPTPERDAKDLSLRYQVQTLESQQLETEKNLDAYKKQHSTLERERRAFEELIKNVFTFTMPAGGGLPQQLRYLHVCGPYQLLCPLPNEQSRSLKKIAAALEQKTSCERYSGLALPH